MCGITLQCVTVLRIGRFNMGVCVHCNAGILCCADDTTGVTHLKIM